VTAADGAEEFYGYGNAARFETIDQAIESDKRLRNVYKSHSHYFLVDNDTEFQTKIVNTINIAQSLLGLPTDLKMFKKYLVDAS